MKPLIHIFFYVLTTASLSCSAFSNTPVIKTLNISQIHPTQPAIGDDEVTVAVTTLQHDRQALFNHFCKDLGAIGVKTFTPQSSLTESTSFSCRAAPGTESQAIKSAVIAPDHHIYLTDGHHSVSTYRALANNQDFPFVVRITADFSQLPSMDKFWSTMQAQHLAWLEDPQGKPILPTQLPQQISLQTMQNDPYRSIVYFLRGIAYDKPEKAPPFLEFYLGSWLRNKLPVTAQQLSTRTGYMAYLQQAAASLVAAQGSEHSTGQADSPTLSALGQRKTVNEKKLAKLAKPDGKLSRLFKQG